MEGQKDRDEDKEIYNDKDIEEHKSEVQINITSEYRLRGVPITNTNTNTIHPRPCKYNKPRTGINKAEQECNKTKQETKAETNSNQSNSNHQN